MKISNFAIKCSSFFLCCLQVCHAETKIFIPNRTNEYPRLIPSGPSLPPVRAKTTSILTINKVTDWIKIAGPIFNQAVVGHHYQQRLDEVFNFGMEEARRLGQKGFLIQTLVITEPVNGGHYKSLSNGGAVMLGVGPSIEGVCHAYRCDDYRSFPVNPRPTGAKEWDPSSGYIWISLKDDGTVQVERYERTAIEQQTRNIALNAELAKTVIETSELQAVSDYATAVARKVKAEDDQRAIEQMIDSRNAAMHSIVENERRYEKEMDRARKAMNVSRSLSFLEDIFDFAGISKIAYDTFSDSAGDITKQEIKPATNIDELRKQLNSIQSDSLASAAKISEKNTALHKDLKRLRDDVIALGHKLDMKINGSKVIDSPPLP